jgi:hypothetical protein
MDIVTQNYPVPIYLTSHTSQLLGIRTKNKETWLVKLGFGSTTVHFHLNENSEQVKTKLKNVLRIREKTFYLQSIQLCG